MKILVEARAASGKSGGVRSYVKGLLRGLDENVEDIQLSVIYDKKINPRLNNSEEIYVKRYGNLGLRYWLNRQVPRELRMRAVDLAHYTKADVPNKKTVPTVVTIYDVIPLIYPNSQKISGKIYWKGALSRAAEKSDKIITISDKSKEDIMRELGVAENKIAVTKLGVDPERFSFNEGCDTVNPYILYVGTVEPRKNVAAIIKAMSKIKRDIPHKLVLAGRHYKGSKELKSLAVKEGVEDRVAWKENVDDDELVKLYSEASVFVWPSIYEGWGFPPQEAMSCGTPVIVSNGGALPEVVGDAGVIVRFSSDDPSEREQDSRFVTNLAEEIKRVLGDNELRKRMIARGKVQSAAHSWGEVTAKTITVYKNLTGI